MCACSWIGGDVVCEILCVRREKLSVMVWLGFNTSYLKCHGVVRL